MKKVYDELYFLRGIAIIGVVVCHQINFLHTSNWVNCFTIYSVSSLIVCAGITKAFSLKKYICNKNSKNEKYDWLSYTFKSVTPIFMSYMLCCIVCGVYYGLWDGADFHEFIVGIMEFGWLKPFYFIKYYVVLSLLAPALYIVIRIIRKILGGGWRTVSVYVAFLFILWIIGYIFRETLTLGGSYLSIYTLGIMVGIDYDAVIKFISKKICVILLFWLASVGLACNTFWAAVGKVEIIGLDSIVEFTINPPNFSVTLYAVMTMALFGYLFGYTNYFAGIKHITNMVRVMGKYSLDIYLWHILCQHLCVRLNMAFQFNIWLLRIVAYVSMFGLPILGRYLYTMIKQKGNMLLQEDGIL